MSDIYKQKVKKYKYLKLKTPYIGGGDEESEESKEKDITNINIKYDYDFEFIGQGGFGCIISPPLQFNNTIYIKNLINDKKLEEIFTNKDYVGKLLSCDNKIFIDEYEDFKKLDKIDKDANHRSKLIFAGYMSKHDIVKKLEGLYDDEEKITKETKEKIKQLYDCLIDPDKKIINSSSSENYGYIISTRVGKSFTKILNSNNFNNNQIITILENLKESIGDLIQKLYIDESIHGDIKFDNMTLDEKLKVYFIDFGFMQKYTDEVNLEKICINHQYPDILYIFFMIKKLFKNNKILYYYYYYNNKISKSNLIKLLKYYKNSSKYSIQSILLNKIKLYKIDYSCFFHSLEDNTKYSLEDFYTKCIKPIAKNIDIYALSLYIYILFDNIYSDINTFKYDFDKNPNTLNILKELLINALYNNIDGPEELIIYIDAIINSIKNGTNTILYKKIEDRRKIKEIPFYYYFADKYIDSKYNNYYK